VASLPLKATVKVESTVELPRHYDLDSIYMDILADPRGQEVFGPFIKKAFSAFGSEREGVSEAAGEAVSEEMGMAMLNYMPIRGALSFGEGVPEEVMDDMLRRLNE
jgi:beta-glucosidase